MKTLDKCTYRDGAVVISAKNLNDIQDSIIDIQKQLKENNKKMIDNTSSNSLQMEISEARNEIKNIKRKNVFITLSSFIAAMLILFVESAAMINLLDSIKNTSNFLAVLGITYLGAMAILCCLYCLFVYPIIKTNNEHVSMLYKTISDIKKESKSYYEELYNKSKIHKIQEESNSLFERN